MRTTNLEPLSREVESLLASERALVAQPEDVRRRAVSRARAAMSTGSVVISAKPWLGFKWMFAAAALLAAATLSAAVLQSRRRVATSSLESARPIPAQIEATTPPAQTGAGDGVPLTDVASEQVDPADLGTSGHAAVSPPRSPTGAEGYALELKILEPARAAVARGDFGAALGAIAEHERRFPSGRLAEEREALRVQSLSGLHRTDDARRAAVTFRKRFPDSVLLSRMKEALRATP